MVQMENQPGDQAGGGSGARTGATRSITLGGGCFWCTEAVFLDVEGVVAVEPGYAGGHVADPTYEAVCTGETGHAEVVLVTYDPARIGLREIFSIFFTIHDPTTLDRQGHDVGTQYRSVIFFHDEEQAEEARRFIAQLEKEKVFRDPIVTEITPASTFYPAEKYHQDFYRANPTQAYCSAVIRPKLDKFQKAFADKLRRE